MNEWVIERLDKERGGIKFVLPNAEGKSSMGRFIPH